MIYSILFSGHMIDVKGRESPRFSQRKENAARKEIKIRLIPEKEKTQGAARGIASGACGGDICFMRYAANSESQLKCNCS
jgi:hypothetical protein